MSDRMTPLPLGEMLNWVSREYKQHRSIFGIPEQKFFTLNDPAPIRMFGHDCDLPLGPAAGPHTQLTQNIICSYLTGARFFELKTVQILDSLEFDKPCIEAQDEGYNTEWSTELSITQAYEEYVKAWLILHLLRELLGSDSTRSPGFIFNMSVGYDLKGISSKPVDKFIESLKNGRDNDFYRKSFDTLQTCLPELFPGLDPEFASRISPKISNSITLSTMHGCPPSEQLSICRYLLREKNLHTYVKLNPTLLGYKRVTEIFSILGYDDIRLNPDSFEHDIQYADAVNMIKDLQHTASRQDLEFGVKLSNTLAVDNTRKVLPGNEMYMSGRSLYPLTINLAAKLAADFEGNLRISFAGGISAQNVQDVYKSGIKPVTLATDLLKPGGYYRLRQMAEQLTSGSETTEPGRIDTDMLGKLAAGALSSEFYYKTFRYTDDMKLDEQLPLTDCYIAPCRENCPISQDVPDYINLIREERYTDALRLIYDRNPLPFITGHVCDHQCMLKCIRNDYEQPVQIRDLKKTAAEEGFEDFLREFTPPVDAETSVAIIGSGPCGLAAASFLGRSGFKITVFERRESAGGMVRHVLPAFRLPDSVIEKDLELLKKQGVEFVFNCDPEPDLADLLEEGFKYVILALGSWQEKDLELEGDLSKVRHAIEFLRDFKTYPDRSNLGRKVIVIGGGNSAMDGARAAVRVKGVKSVSIVYRRTEREMPADREEFDNAMEDGVEFLELLQPVSWQEGKLRCHVMELGEPDDSGRRKPIARDGKFRDIPADSVIVAIGEEPETSLFKKWDLQLNQKGFPVTDSNLQSNLENVYIGGDSRTGPATVVEAIAEARKISDHILSRENITCPVYFDPGPGDDQSRIEQSLEQKGNIQLPGAGEPEEKRCLDCALVCSKCVEVCPNRANVAVKVPGLKDRFQIIHLDAFCNECGNCETFCPYRGAPYRDKLTAYASANAFKDGENSGFYLAQDKKALIRLGEEKFTVTGKGPLLEASFDQIREKPELQNIIDIINAVRQHYNYLLVKK